MKSRAITLLLTPMLWLGMPFAASAQLQMSLSIANPPAAEPAPVSAPPTDAKATAKTVAAVNAITVLPEPRDCKNPKLSNLSRFWELEKDSDCGTFGIRGYHPTSLSVIGSDGVNTQPMSPAEGHSALSSTPYSPIETRIQVSVKTKIAGGLLTQGNERLRDSLWFGYSQQSYWQFFNTDLSRPFRTTDHEPEITYIYPSEANLPGGWHLRYSGLSLVHQSNGQALPLSRSWNRVVLMAGMDKTTAGGSALRMTGRVWQRLPEKNSDDDNPEISDTVGRAELATFWDVNAFNTLGLTLRHSLKSEANGSFKFEWLKSFGDTDPRYSRNGLRFHTQLFSGFGDSLVDYNRRRTVLSVGLSLVDW
jgi:phospholipase A1/A2